MNAANDGVQPKQRDHCQSTYLSHPRMYGETPSEAGRLAAACVRELAGVHG